MSVFNENVNILSAISADAIANACACSLFVYGDLSVGYNWKCWFTNKWKNHETWRWPHIKRFLSKRPKHIHDQTNVVALSSTGYCNCASSLSQPECHCPLEFTRSRFHYSVDMWKIQNVYLLFIAQWDLIHSLGNLIKDGIFRNL